MEQVKMPYRIYKQRYDNCETLNDYDPSCKTITVIIPKRKRTTVDKSVWQKTSNGWEMISDTSKSVIHRGSGIASTWEAIWCERVTRHEFLSGRWNGWKSKCFTLRDDALSFLVSIN